MNQALYDRALLAGFADGDRDLERAILADFCRHSREHVASLMSAGNVEELAARAHKLKGAARAVGVWSIAQLCEEAEADPEMAIAALEQLGGRVLGVIARLEAVLDESTSLARPLHMG